MGKPYFAADGNQTDIPPRSAPGGDEIPGKGDEAVW